MRQISLKTDRYTRMGCVVGFLLLGCSLQMVAQERLTLEQCRTMALQKSEDLQIAGRQVDIADEQRKAVRTLRLPGLAVAATGIWQDEDFEMELMLPTQVPNPATGQLEPNLLVDPSTGSPVMGPDGNPLFNMYAWLPLSVSLSGAYMAGITLEQPVYTGGRINAGSRMAAIGREMAGDNRSLQAMNVVAEVDNAYWTLVSVEQKVRLAQTAVSMLEQVTERARHAHEAGMAGKNDLLKAGVELNRAKLQLQKAQNGLSLSRMDLCRIIGLPLNSTIVAVDTLPGVAIRKHPDVNSRPVNGSVTDAISGETSGKAPERKSGEDAERMSVTKSGEDAGKATAMKSLEDVEKATAIQSGEIAGIVSEARSFTMEEAALANRPEYRLLQRQIGLKEQQIRMAKAEFLPEAGVQAGYNYIGGIEFGDTDFSNNSLVAMASVKIPIFHWGEGMRKVNAARLEKEMSELELQKNRQLLLLEIEQARLDLELAYKRISMGESALQQAEEALRVARDNYEVGMETMTELLIAQTRWQEAYSEQIDAWSEFMRKENAWRKASGQLSVP